MAAKLELIRMLRSPDNARVLQAIGELRALDGLVPGGGSYDGRYNLAGDRDFALWGRVDPDDPAAMAEFFGVSLDSYLLGQKLGRQLAAAEAH